MAAPTWLGAAIQAAGGVGSNALNWWQQNKMNKWNERMANTAHQREVRDLRAAGLNPILSGTGGKGAPLPQLSAAKFDNALSEAGATVASASRLSMDRTLLDAQVEKIRADTAVSRKQTEVMDSQMELNRLSGILTAANARMTTAKTPEQETWKRVFEVVNRTIDKYFGPNAKGVTVEDVVRKLEKEGEKEAEKFIREKIIGGFTWKNPIGGFLDKVGEAIWGPVGGQPVAPSDAERYGGTNSAKDSLRHPAKIIDTRR